MTKMQCPVAVDSAYADTDPHAGPARRILMALYLLTGVIYLGWRLTVFNPGAMVVSALFYLIELGGFLTSILLFFVIMRRRSRTPVPARAGLSVDVFVTTRNEDLDLVRRTLIAAMRIRYPHETWLLDDGNRPAFRNLTTELGCRYLARAGNAGAKAGNLNHGLKHSRGDYVAILDADHCADPNFLHRVLGYFEDPQVALVQTPQDYYNLNSFQHGRDRDQKLIWHDQSGFHHVEQPGRDFHDSATLCGCSCVMRRAHLELIGGFPTETVTEDMHAAVKLQKLGLKTVYHDEPLAFGVAPPDLRGFLVQRLRWGEGNMQVCRIERLPFSRRLTLRQNLSYLLLSLVYVDAWRKLALYVAPIYTLLTDTPPVFGEPLEFIVFFLPYVVIGTLTYKELYAGFGRVLQTEAYTMARLGAGLAATWGLVRRHIRFRISSKRLVSRASFLLAAPQAAIFLGGLAAIVWAVYTYLADVAGYRGMWISPGIVLFLALLAAYHCLLAFNVVRETIRSAGTNEMNYRFDVHLPVRLSLHGRSVVGWTDLISVDGATVQLPSSTDLDGKTVEVEIFVPSGRLEARGRVQTSGKNTLQLHFVWLSLAGRDELNHALHAGRWHRIVTGRYEVEMSPLERLGLLQPPPGRQPHARGVWEPVLMKTLGRPKELRVAYLRPAPLGIDWNEIILFGVHGGIVEIAASRVPQLIGRRFNIENAAERPLLDESGLEGHGGYRRRLDSVDRVAEIEFTVSAEPSRARALASEA